MGSNTVPPPLGCFFKESARPPFLKAINSNVRILCFSTKWYLLLTYLTGELEDIWMQLVSSSCAQRPPLSHRNGALPNAIPEGLSAVKVLNSDHAFVACSVKDEPSPAPFLWAGDGVRWHGKHW